MRSLSLSRVCWQADDYHVCDKNCVHFADTLGAEVVDGGVPRPLLQGVLDVSERMLDSLPEWRMKLGRRVMNEVTSRRGSHSAQLLTTASPH